VIITRNQPDPARITSVVLPDSELLNKPRVTEPADRDAATMNKVADTTSAHPARKPSTGCRTRPTQA
jgi:hypothetical protein